MSYGLFNAPPSSTEHFHFTGKAGEYFGVWIVNLFLTIITLGIYSAWAKVRKKRYYYGNTWLAGSNFEYHGNPVAILKGRLIAFAAFASYTFAAQFSPRTAAIVAVVLMPAIPWLLIRSYAFNAVNSSYRNLRFHFNAGYREAVAALGPAAVVPLLTLVLPEVDQKPDSFGAMDFVLAFIPLLVFWIIYPYLVARTRLLRINNSRYGTAPFGNPLQVRAFYWVYLQVTLLFAGLLAVFAGAFWVTLKIPFAAVVVMPFLYVLIFAITFAFSQARVSNLVFNATKLDGRLAFRSELSAQRLMVIYSTNMLAVIFTLGLAIPWAAMRNARYRAECLSVECEGGIENFLADVATHVSATGEEMGEMFDVDFSL